MELHRNKLRSHCQYQLEKFAKFTEAMKKSEVEKLKKVIMDRVPDKKEVEGFEWDVRFVNSLYVRLVPPKKKKNGKVKAKANGKAKKGSKKKSEDNKKEVLKVAATSGKEKEGPVQITNMGQLKHVLKIKADRPTSTNRKFVVPAESTEELKLKREADKLLKKE